MGAESSKQPTAKPAAKPAAKPVAKPAAKPAAKEGGGWGHTAAEAPWLHSARAAISEHKCSLRFHRAQLLNYDERLEDGFLALFSRELLRVDSRKDAAVKNFVGFVRGCLPTDESAAFSPASRVAVVAKAVAAALGGAESAGSLEERWDKWFTELRADPPKVLPLGALFASGAGAHGPGRPVGIARHRAVLLKYVCDQLDICYSALVETGVLAADEAPALGPAADVVNVVWVSGRALAVDCLENPGHFVTADFLHRFLVQEAESRLGQRPFSRLRPASAGAPGSVASMAATPAAASRPAASRAEPPSPLGGGAHSGANAHHFTAAWLGGRPPGAPPAPPGAPVQAFVYDISEGVAAKMSPLLLGKYVELVPHTGIVAFGKEYFFGNGPSIGEPGRTVPLPAAKVLELGETQRTREELEHHIRTVLALEHTSQNYNLLTHNCNHFADDVVKFLLPGGSLPDDIVEVAERALSTPEGHGLRSIIEEMENSARSGAQGLNPFGDEGGSAAAGAPSRSDVA